MNKLAHDPVKWSRLINLFGVTCDLKEAEKEPAKASKAADLSSNPAEKVLNQLLAYTLANFSDSFHETKKNTQTAPATTLRTQSLILRVCFEVFSLGFLSFFYPFQVVILGLPDLLRTHGWRGAEANAFAGMWSQHWLQEMCPLA